MALYSFIHSLSTTIGTLYEQVAIALACERFKVVKTQVKPFNQISSEAYQKIQTIMDELAEQKRQPNGSVEVEKIRQVCQTGTLKQIGQTRVDVWLENHDGELFLIDLKTVTPARDHCERYKRTLLQCVLPNWQEILR